MIADLKPYPAMKNTGVEWLGEVPEHWGIRRSKYIFRCIDERSKTGDEQLLTVSSANGVIPRRSTSVTMFKAESYVGHKLCWPDDLVINSLWAWGRGLGFSEHHGIVSTAYGVYRLRSRDEAEASYLDTLVRSTPFHWELRIRSKGIWISRLQLTDESFLNSELPLPPLPDQAAIVRYLDHVGRRVRRLVGAKRKLIALLTEQKQAIIHCAVTRGLDPGVPLKDSRVEWLGEVPEHWEVISLGVASRSIQTGPFGSQLHSGEYVVSGVPVINPSHMRDGQICADDAIAVSREKARALARHVLLAGDIVAARRGELGRCAIVTESEAGWLCGTGSLRIRPKSYMFESAYLLCLLGSQGVRDTLCLLSIGATMDNLNAGMVSRLRLPLPPIEEQREIMKSIASASNVIASGIDLAHREISLLNEYLTRLIADVVTGKLDVREAASALPEVDPLDTIPEEAKA